jgi:hypothetical protein
MALEVFLRALTSRIWPSKISKVMTAADSK